MDLDNLEADARESIKKQSTREKRESNELRGANVISMTAFEEEK